MNKLIVNRHGQWIVLFTGSSGCGGSNDHLLDACWDGLTLVSALETLLVD